MQIRMLFSSLVLAGSLAACTQESNVDDSMYLTGTEESAVTLANGQLGCTSPKKALICHIPPGNPANAHSICVGNAAVTPHQTHHGDLVGACATEPPPDDGGGDDCDGTCDGDGSGDPTPTGNPI